MIYGAFAFVYVMGAFMMWEEAVRMPRGPSPKGAGYSKELQEFYDKSGPRLKLTGDSLSLWSCVTFWPLVMALGIVWRVKRSMTSDEGRDA